MLKDNGTFRKLRGQDNIVIKESDPSKRINTSGNHFIAPEVCLGKQYDGKADVWAIGVILYELIMFKKPFRDEGVVNMFR